MNELLHLYEAWCSTRQVLGWAQLDEEPCEDLLKQAECEYLSCSAALDAFILNNPAHKNNLDNLKNGWKPEVRSSGSDRMLDAYIARASNTVDYTTDSLKELEREIAAAARFITKYKEPSQLRRSRSDLRRLKKEHTHRTADLFVERNALTRLENKLIQWTRDET